MMKASDLTGPALDWAVAVCQGYKMERPKDLQMINSEGHRILINASESCKQHDYSPSTNWLLGGPIIEREEFCLMPILEDDDSTAWAADKRIDDLWDQNFTGQTPLIAAMRCYVASKLGNEIEIPKELV